MTRDNINPLRKQLLQKPNLNLYDAYKNIICETNQSKLNNILDNLISDSIKHKRRGHSSKALLSVEKALKQSPGFFPATMIKAEILAEKKNIRELEKLFSNKALSPNHYGGIIEILLKNNLLTLAEKVMLLGLKKFAASKNLPQYIRAVIFQREMDTFFSSKMDALDFKAEIPDIFYRLAELYCQFGNTKKMKFFFKKFSLCKTVHKKPHQMLNAFCAIGEFAKIIDLKLMFDYPYNAAEIHYSLNPFEKIIDPRHLRFLIKKLDINLRKNPQEQTLKFLKALLMQQSSLEKAAGILSGINSSNLKLNALAQYNAGEIFLNSLNFKKAYSHFQKAFKIFPGCEILTGKISESLIGMGRVKEALTKIQTATKKRKSAGLLAWYGELLLLSGNYAKAEAILTKASKECRGMSYCWLGASLFKLGKIDGAMENLNKAIETNPDDLEALIWRAEVNIKLNNFREALRDIKKAGQLDKKFLWVYLSAARIHLLEKEFKQAITAFKKAPLYIRKFLIKKTRISPPLNIKSVDKALLKAFKLAKGNRRYERYMSAFWMK